MIRPLRTRHRWMIVAIALATGVLMVLGLLARHPMPTVERLVSASEGQTSTESAGLDP